MKLLEVTGVYHVGIDHERIYKRRTVINLDRVIMVHEDFTYPQDRAYIYYDSGEGEGGLTVDESIDSLILRMEAMNDV